MSSSIQSYNEALLNMNASNVGLDPSKVPPVLEDEINDKIVVGKSALQGISGVMVAQAATSTLKKVLKGSKAAKNAGIADEDIDNLADAAASGDLESLGTQALGIGIKSANRALGQGVSYLQDAGRSLGDKILGTFKNNPAAENTPVDDIADNPMSFRNQMGSDLESDIFSGKSDINDLSDLSDPFKLAEGEDVFGRVTGPARGLLGAGQGDSTLARATGGGRPAPAQPEPEPEPAGPAQPAPDDDIKPVPEADTDPAPLIEGADSDMDLAAVRAAKAAKDVSEVTKIGEGMEATGGATFDPIEAGLGALLGIGGTIAAVFIKTHHVKNVVNNFVQEKVPVNYASTLL